MAKGVRRIRLLVAALALTAAPALAPAPASADQLYGVSPLATPTAAELGTMGGAGVDLMRAVLSWPEVEPTRGGGYDWDKFDAIVTDAAENGIDLLPIFYGSPDWAVDCGGLSSAECRRKPPLDSARARSGWSDFVRAAVARYGPDGSFWTEEEPLPDPGDPGLPAGSAQVPPDVGGEPPPYNPIRFWQVWNEPSSPTYWKPHPDPTAYADLVELSDRAVDAEDPGATTVLAGLFGTPFGGRYPDLVMWRYLKGLYRVKGTKRHFDAVALHPYAPNLDGIKYQLRRARRVMRRHDDRRTPIWITEIGWGSGDRSIGALNKGLGGQRRMLEKSFRLFAKREARWKIRAVIWFTWRDPSGDVEGCSDSFCRSSGLLTREGRKKPAFEAFRDFAGGDY